MKRRHEVSLADMAIEHYKTTPQDFPSILTKTTFAYASATGFLQSVIGEMAFSVEQMQARIGKARTMLGEVMSKLDPLADEDTWKLLEQIEENVRFVEADVSGQINTFDRAVARVAPPARDRLVA